MWTPLLRRSKRGKFVRNEVAIFWGSYIYQCDYKYFFICRIKAYAWFFLFFTILYIFTCFFLKPDCTPCLEEHCPGLVVSSSDHVVPAIVVEPTLLVKLPILGPELGVALIQPPPNVASVAAVVVVRKPVKNFIHEECSICYSDGIYF